MSAKAILVLCAQALLVKCTSRAAVADVSRLAAPYGLAAPCGLAAPAWAGHHHHHHPMDICPGRGLAYDGVYAPVLEFSATSGGTLPVSSASAIAPVGISVVSDNVYEGALAVGGELPFVGTVALEGLVPSAGAGAVKHACGNGRNAMITETSAFDLAGAYAPMGAYGLGAVFAPSAFAPGFGTSAFFRGGAGRACGCAY